jgi:hypothetical protein
LNRPNGVKIVYCLLIKYRNEHLECYPGLSEAQRRGENIATRILNRPKTPRRQRAHGGLKANFTILSFPSVDYYADDLSDGTKDDNEFDDSAGQFSTAEDQYQILLESRGSAEIQPSRGMSGTQDTFNTRQKRRSRSSLFSTKSEAKVFVAPMPSKRRVVYKNNKIMNDGRQSRMGCHVLVDHKWVEEEDIYQYPDIAEDGSESLIKPLKLRVFTTDADMENARRLKRRSRELEKFCHEQTYWATRRKNKSKREENWATLCTIDSPNSILGTFGTVDRQSTRFMGTENDNTGIDHDQSESLVTGSHVANDGSECTEIQSVDESEALGVLWSRVSRITVPRLVESNSGKGKAKLAPEEGNVAPIQTQGKVASAQYEDQDQCESTYSDRFSDAESPHQRYANGNLGLEKRKSSFLAKTIATDTNRSTEHIKNLYEDDAKVTTLNKNRSASILSSSEGIHKKATGSSQNSNGGPDVKMRKSTSFSRDFGNEKARKSILHTSGDLNQPKCEPGLYSVNSRQNFALAQRHSVHNHQKQPRPGLDQHKSAPSLHLRFVSENMQTPHETTRPATDNGIDVKRVGTYAEDSGETLENAVKSKDDNILQQQSLRKKRSFFERVFTLGKSKGQESFGKAEVQDSKTGDFLGIGRTIRRWTSRDVRAAYGKFFFSDKSFCH